jgi:hypothetical protein
LSGSYTGVTGVGTLTAGTWNATAIGAVYGGTGLTSYAVGDLLYADTTTTLAQLADVAVGNALISGGVSANPSWGKIGLATHVDGTLPIANGGTGSTSTQFVDLATNVTGTLPVGNGGTGAATFTANNVLLGNGTSAFQVVAPGTLGNVLQSDGTTWVSASAPSGMVYPGAGIPNSTGTSWGTSYSTSGSGTVVALTTSPSFTTPALGTPSSGNLANCTFPTLNQSTTGTASNITAYTINQSVGTANNVRFNSLGVGTAGSGTAGEIRATNNVTAYYSDDRLKTKLGGIQDALAKVKTLSGFYYEANQTAQDLGYEAVREVGVSAQQVQAVLPEIVVPAPIDDKYLTVRYEKLIPLLIEAVKELSGKVTVLEAKLEQLTKDKL